MQVITLSRCKELLGINSTDTTYDTDLQIAIPVVDAAVKQITNNRWNYRVAASFENSSDTVQILSVVSPKYFMRDGYYSSVDTIDEFLRVGQLISATGIPSGAYIEEVYYNYPEGVIVSDNYIAEVTISETTTAEATTTECYLGIPIAYQPIIAKACWWQKEQMSTTINDTSWKSKSMGPISITKGGGSERIDNKSGMPLWLVQALPRYMSGH
jgi:hypothetical protein